MTDKVGYNEVRPIIEFLAQAYLDGKIDTIEVIYPHLSTPCARIRRWTRSYPFSLLKQSWKNSISASVNALRMKSKTTAKLFLSPRPTPSSTSCRRCSSATKFIK